MRAGGSRPNLGTEREAAIAASRSSRTTDVGEPGPDEGPEAAGDEGKEVMRRAVGGGEGRADGGGEGRAKGDRREERGGMGREEEDRVGLRRELMQREKQSEGTRSLWDFSG